MDVWNDKYKKRKRFTFRSVKLRVKCENYLIQKWAHSEPHISFWYFLQKNVCSQHYYIQTTQARSEEFPNRQNKMKISSIEWLPPINIVKSLSLITIWTAEAMSIQAMLVLVICRIPSYMKPYHKSYFPRHLISLGQAPSSDTMFYQYNL